MNVVILCGGKGERLREQTETIPKPLVEIGGKPMLWHIMKIYSYYGYNDFILCLGYKGEIIKRYFMDEVWKDDDFTLDFGKKDKNLHFHSDNHREHWTITFAETGAETNTGGRIKRVEKYIMGDTFLATYGDGLAAVNVKDAVSFHHKHGRAATLTAIRPNSPFGVMSMKADGTITSFEEKPLLQQWINGGFFVFNRKIFSYLKDNDVLEKEPFNKLAEDKEIVAYQHTGYWRCMDTYKDTRDLNDLWKTGNAPWHVWR